MKRIFKSSITGRIVSREYAEANPDITFEQEVEARETPVANAVKRLTKALREDKEFYFAYQSNIAMSFFDAMKPRISKQTVSDAELHEAANESAVNFLNLWIREQENPAEIDENIRENKPAK